MNLLVFSDLHGSMKTLKGIVSKSKSADLVLCLGDLTIFEQNLKGLLAELGRIEKPVLLIPGNHEHGPTLEKLSKAYGNMVYMDKKIFENDQVLIYGIEGNGFSIKDKHFENVSKKFLPLIKASKKKFILMTHAPPHGTTLDKLQDGHCGNKSIRAFIKKTRPVYAFSGHIHENSGNKDKIGDTIVLNAGPKGTIIKV